MEKTPLHVDSSCKYVESAIADGQQGVVLCLGGLMGR
jgi:hypothetical protein